MNIAATLEINIYQLTYKKAYTCSKVLIAVCPTSDVITAITLYFEKVK